MADDAYTKVMLEWNSGAKYSISSYTRSFRYIKQALENPEDPNLAEQMTDSELD